MSSRDSSSAGSSATTLQCERYALLRQLDHWLEVPMLILGFVWLVLLVVELTTGLTPVLEAASLTIWIVFIVDFLLKFAIAPRKLRFLRKNWMTELSLILPALRLLRIARIARLLRLTRAARGIRLFRLVSSLNRGLRALRSSMGRHGFGYVMALVVVVIFAGAAGMFAFERGQEPGLPSYSAALWWTAMMITTVGSDYFPVTPEGRILCLLLATFAFTVWGYVTATLATAFLGKDEASEKGPRGEPASVEQLRRELRAMREAMEEMAGRGSGTGERA